MLLCNYVQVDISYVSGRLGKQKHVCHLDFSIKGDKKLTEKKTEKKHQQKQNAIYLFSQVYRVCQKNTDNGSDSRIEYLYLHLLHSQNETKKCLHSRPQSKEGHNFISIWYRINSAIRAAPVAAAAAAAANSIVFLYPWTFPWTKNTLIFFLKM